MCIFSFETQKMKSNTRFLESQSSIKLQNELNFNRKMWLKPNNLQIECKFRFSKLCNATFKFHALFSLKPSFAECLERYYSSIKEGINFGRKVENREKKGSAGRGKGGKREGGREYSSLPLEICSFMITDETRIQQIQTM